MRATTICAFVASHAALSGCALNFDEIVTPSEARVLAARSRSYDDQDNRLRGLSNTAFAAVPTTGTATYTGGAAIRIDTQPRTSALAGASEVTVDFWAGTVSGQITRIFGTDQRRDLAEYRGEISLSSGRIGVDRPNDISMTYQGVITGNGDVITLNGSVSGALRGSPIQGLTVSSTPGDVVTLNGSPVGVKLDISASE